MLTIVPEYPPKILGVKVMSELKMAYCTAVNDTLVKLDKNAINAAPASPEAKLSTMMAKYNHKEL
ncbi:hypothetical protein D3C73_1285140 [compost metagenome]